MITVDPASTRLDLRPLFEPLTVNGLSFRNRWVMPAMQRGWALPDGGVSEKTIGYYEERALGGTALIITESLGVDHPAAHVGSGIDMHLNADTFDGWRRVARAVHAHGARFFVQLWHPGAMRKEGHGRNPDVPPISPSGVFGAHPHGKAATHEDLEDLKAAYVEGALRARALGADGVEFHMAHGYLLHQFLSPSVNCRADRYGGPNIADRVRFPAEIVRAVRAALGPRFPLSARISQWSEADYSDRVAPTPDELRTLISTLREAGVDVFHMSTRYFHTPEWPEQSRLPLAGWVKTMTDAPVIAVGSVGLDVDGLVGGFTSRIEKSNLLPSLAELGPRIRRQEFDMIAVGRSIIGDPDFVCKIRNRRFDEVNLYSKAEAMPILDEATLMEHLQPEVLRAASIELARMERETTADEPHG
jgi:2,4-dienoyl-CoA reductase-like NADH-dependent reductase (Old Yellow Enzyme family)